MKKTWSACMTKAQQHFKAAENFLLLKDLENGMRELTKSQQWLAEAGLMLVTEDKL